MSDDTIPAVCYNDCNNAYLEGQRAGNDTSLCQGESTFLGLKAACKACLQAHNANYAPIESYLTYCEGSSMPAPTVAPTVVPTATPRNGGHPTTVDVTGSPASGRLVTITVTATGTAGGRNTVATLIRWAMADLHTTFILPVTYLELPKSLTETSTAIPTTTTNDPPTPESTLSPASPVPATHNMAWVAGPVIGGVAAIAALGFLGFWRRRKRNNRTLGGTAEGPTQGEMDGREKQEIPGSQFGVNLRGNDSGRPIQELEAGRMYRNESADVHGLHEVEGTQAPGPSIARDNVQAP
ncbi:hypothetical protein PG993_005716 [Apiospora rasikravindrae]|uniref:Uncharacterized protein n=1 Tax=Apiospora rasikravindrae TaxID=990691 RepID=A0ABR1T9L6_9PEZI